MTEIDQEMTAKNNAIILEKTFKKAKLQGIIIELLSRDRVMAEDIKTYLDNLLKGIENVETL